MHHRSSLRNPNKSGERPKKKVTWTAPPELWSSTGARPFLHRKSLYGTSLQDLCARTQNNLSRLASFPNRSRNIFLTLKMPGEGHPKVTSDTTSNDNQRSESGPDERNHRKSAAPSGTLRSKDAIKYLQQSIQLDRFPCDDSDVDTDRPEPAYTLCYFCSTTEEHRRHIKTKKHVSKPRIIIPRYVAPRPKVRVRSAPCKIQTPVNHENLYKLTICTGDVEKAGTTANVFIAIEGRNNFLPLTKLQKSSGSVKFSFQRNSKEIFYIRGPFLGELKTLVVEHSGLEDVHSWFLDSIEVCDVFRLRRWTFKCGQWLSLHCGKRRLRLQLNLNSDSQQASYEEYRITVETGKCRMAGTNANVFITLYGKESQSDKILLANQHRKCFQRGNTDTFDVRSDKPLGELKRIRIEHDNKGTASGWYLNKITIESLQQKGSSESQYVFPYNGWLADDTEGGKLWREIEAQNDVTKTSKEEKLKKYQIFTKTGTQRFSGTNARVFIQIFGAHKKTSKLMLKSGGNCFGRGTEDLFDVEAIDVGDIRRILIGHDNSGISSGWYLKQVVVRSYEPKEKPTKTKQHRKYRKASAGSNVLSDISDISDEEENNEQHNNALSKTKSKIKSKKVSEPAAYIEYTFICEQWLATDEGDGKTSKSLELTDVKCFYE